MALPIDELQALMERVREATAPLEDEPQLRQAALAKVLEHELARLEREAQGSPSIESESRHSPPLKGALSSPTQPEATPYPPYESAQERAQVVAAYLEISLVHVHELYRFHTDEPSLYVLRNDLGAGTWEESDRQLALLILVARTALQLESGTRNIRNEIGDMAIDDEKFDKAANDLAESGDIELHGRSGAPNRLVTLTPKGVDAAREVAQGIFRLER